MNDTPVEPALAQVLRARGGFGHREHLELAWLYLRGGGLPRARRQMASAIRHLAAAHGTPDRYHETITLAWLQLVAVHAAGSTAETFKRFIDENPGLLARHLLTGHYSPDLLGGSRARREWVEPDVRALPALP